MDLAHAADALTPDTHDADRVRSLLKPGKVTAAFQPIVCIRDDEVVGHEGPRPRGGTGRPLSCGVAGVGAAPRTPL